MKFMKYSAVLALVAFSLSLGAFAKDRNEGKFTLSDPATVGSTQLKPGDYKATWEGSGSDVQVKILQGKNVVATSFGQIGGQSDAARFGDRDGTAAARTYRSKLTFRVVTRPCVCHTTNSAESISKKKVNLKCKAGYEPAIFVGHRAGEDPSLRSGQAAREPPGRQRYFCRRHFWTTRLSSLPGT